ncbi:hypothetical protein FRACYDRAFT_250209 [Fragilariopsis cylindrus CCMP1102]|uniref:G-protein coupled receptors family 2 profile 2 domain-containing protein n=1 Tax=Fragilariopsis cylindrus CCMP1102 TaxID=635003 RepID=A0A1E7EPV6_9STRA|nr:hypothetical protein FRACYDRAFT_250209 [Fragilariopsis cylindrus CCMP1102]|eukprot:OEU07989.1 hypothetical protein FRACYDRAFT_250209 [Fragilariopsis cylindrus CCMP1102]
MATIKYILFIVPKFTSLLSILGSTMIISQVLQSKENRGHTQQRLVCVMSIIDLTVSTAWFLTPLFVPKEFEQFLWGIGTTSTCSLQYKFQCRDMVIIEKYMHAFALLFGIATATTALVLNLYEDANWDCCISSTAQTFQWAFFFAPLWIAIIFVITLVNLSGAELPEWLIALAGSFIPFQGFFNAMVYFRLRLQNCSKANPERSSVWVIRSIMKHALCGCCVSCCSNTHDHTCPDGLDIEPNPNRATAVTAEATAEAEESFNDSAIIIICLCQRKQDDNVRVQSDYPDDVYRNEPIEMKSQWEPSRDSARQNIGRMSWGDQVDNNDYIYLSHNINTIYDPMSCTRTANC